MIFKTKHCLNFNCFTQHVMSYCNYLKYCSLQHEPKWLKWSVITQFLGPCNVPLWIWLCLGAFGACWRNHVSSWYLVTKWTLKWWVPCTQDIYGMHIVTPCQSQHIVVNLLKEGVTCRTTVGWKIFKKLTWHENKYGKEGPKRRKVPKLLRHYNSGQCVA